MKKLIVILSLFLLPNFCLASSLDKSAVWERSDGGISILTFDTRDMKEGETEDQFTTRMIAKHQANFGSVAPQFVSKSNIPTDKTNRNEWSLKNGKVEVDPVKLAAKAAKEAEKEAVLSKLKISKEELEKLRGLI